MILLKYARNVDKMIEDKKLKIKVGSKEEAYWSEVVDNATSQVEDMEKALKFQKAVLDMAKDKLLKGGIDNDN